MSLRYAVLTLALGVAGAFLVVMNYAVGSGTLDSIVFGVSIGILIAAAGAVTQAETRAQRAAVGVIVPVAAFQILVALGIFSGAAQTWIEFGLSAGIAALALAGNLSATVARERIAAGNPATGPLKAAA